ncbi:Fungal specific transcription factor, putative [Coccidioides posadasii C735 delta SOWgp]|uniref:Fungal specific transcription factor, putative n=1 Tax=Coccidioides posadasii (strain C735) TaxID=222929 RepID=C5P1R4_COCP7|nr:Fungal specific transcription factor, putative [Coccidioides posadasii C735 delta SOWgp]EER29622.1 Fungal specific transcription factor, putative [Coccidioides posadasii C735 delta SOWgp]|eukprot:XP_003071767.1 Fungal specific transcription factor, putative [Coccidioides posadasii C735 delta SOWgp]
MDVGRHINPSAQTASTSANSDPQPPPHHSPSDSPHSPYSGQGHGDNRAVPGAAPGTVTGTGSNVGGPDSLADLKRPRACEACRQLKVRCDPDTNHPDGSCKRCTKANRRCIVTVPTRKRQRKADSRVAELEKKIDALTASLHASRAQNSSGDQPDPPLRQTLEQEGLSARWLGQFPSRNNSLSGPQSNGASVFAGAKRHHSGELKKPPVSRIFAPLPARHRSPSDDGPTGAHNAHMRGSGDGDWPPLYSSFEPEAKPRVENEYRDVIDRGVVDIETSTKAFERYVNDMAPSAPFVVFPPGTTMSDVRRTKPVLFLSILSISIATFCPQLQLPLQNETHRVFADRILVRGEKSLELVQALLVATLWYLPPDHFEELKFYQFIHTAAVMGVDIGMNRKTKPNSKASEMWKEIFGNKVLIVDPKSLEVRRAWLGCYSMAVNASISLRRPLFVRWQPYNDECIDMLKTSPDALPSDQTVIHWVKLAHITEDVGFQFSMDDPTTNVNITDPKIQYALKGFERQLDDWRKEVPSDLYTPVLAHHDHILNIYMHEIGMHIDHNIDDFKPPFIADIGEDSPADLGTAAHVDALTTCLTSIHKSLQLFCSIGHQDLMCLPTIYFVRMTYGSIALLKLFSLVISSGSRLSHIFNPADFKVEYFLDKLIQHLRACGDTDGGRLGAKFALIIAMLKSCYMRSKDKRQPLVVPPFLQPRDSDDANPNSLKLSGLNSKASADGGPTPLHVLSEVATGHPQDVTSKQEQSNQHQAPQISPPGEARNPSVTIHPSTHSEPIDQTAPTTKTIPSDTPISGPTGVLMTPYINQQMGLGPISAPHPAITAGYQPTYSQHPGFTPAPGTMEGTGQQQDVWSQGFLPDADLNLALALQGNVWDDDLFSFGLDWSDRAF